MLTPARILSFFLMMTGLGGIPGSSSAQILETSIEGSDLTATYARLNNVSVSIETSLDLASWSPATSRDLLIEGADGTEFVKSSVAISRPGPFFLRLKSTTARPVDLSWNAVDDPAVIGYRLYFSRADGLGTLSELDVGNATTALVFLPVDGKIYSFVVTCYDAVGGESPPSDPLSVAPPWPG